MDFNSKISHLLLLESAQQCQMFWCIPVKTGDDGFKWEVITFNSTGDDLSNWPIVLFKMKRSWGKNFEQLKGMPNCLPRGILYNGYLYHGNNLPVNLLDIARSLKIELGTEYKPVYHNRYSVSSKELRTICDILGVELDIPTVDVA